MTPASLFALYTAYRPETTRLPDVVRASLQVYAMSAMFGYYLRRVDQRRAAVSAHVRSKGSIRGVDWMEEGQGATTTFTSLYS